MVSLWEVYVCLYCLLICIWTLDTWDLHRLCWKVIQMSHCVDMNVILKHHGNICLMKIESNLPVWHLSSLLFKILVQEIPLGYIFSLSITLQFFIAMLYSNQFNACVIFQCFFSNNYSWHTLPSFAYICTTTYRTNTNSKPKQDIEFFTVCHTCIKRLLTRGDKHLYSVYGSRVQQK